MGKAVSYRRGNLAMINCPITLTCLLSISNGLQNCLSRRIINFRHKMGACSTSQKCVFAHFPVARLWENEWGNHYFPIARLWENE